MTFPEGPLTYTCARCLRARQRSSLAPSALLRIRPLSTTPISPHPQPQATSKHEDEHYERDVREEQEEDRGAMSRRLAEMSETVLEEGGRSARKVIEEAGFDEDLKRRLEERLRDAQAGLSDENSREWQRARSLVDMPSSAGRGTRDTAGAEPWSGTESVEDAALRMLTDVHKPIMTPSKIPTPRGIPIRVAPKSKPSSTGSRLMNARDRSSTYSYLNDPSLSDKEREQMRKQLKERFAPAAREVPATLQGLASLANERIEDAIARGQFKNLPRGQKIERDYNASSPFLDTTEYFMNKIIQKQDIVPPWIEKQQELVSTATKFRSRLRNDWKRHASRLIASKGGTLQDQIRKAEEYAAAEALVNPPKRKEEKINTVDSKGHMSQITLSGELTSSTKPYEASAGVETTITIEAHPTTPAGEVKPGPSDPATEITVTQEAPAASPKQASIANPSPESQQGAASVLRPMVPPFRDPSWEATESSYHNLAISELNNLTRSYNLMAPNLAKKPYFSLDRELRACYADVAPQLAAEIRDRATRKAVQGGGDGKGREGLLANFEIGGGKVRVQEDRRKKYGFKEFWRDLFAKKGTG